MASHIFIPMSPCIAPKPPTDTTGILKDEAEKAAQYDLCFDIKCQDYDIERYVQYKA